MERPLLKDAFLLAIVVAAVGALLVLVFVLHGVVISGGGSVSPPSALGVAAAGTS